MAWTDIVTSLFVGGRAQNSVVSDGEQHWWGGSLGGVFGSTPSAGQSFSHAQAMTVSAVFACTRARSEILASLPGMVFLELENNVRRRHAENDLWRMLHDAPNPEMDSMTFYELMQMRIVNRGNGFAIIERDRKDRPKHLWPVHPSRVEPARDNKGELYWQVFSDYADYETDQLRVKNVAARDMLNVVGFGGNGYIGCGVVPVAVEEISLNMAMTRYGGSFFKSGAKPIGFIEHPKYIDDKNKRREFRQDANRAHSGADNWNQIGVLWEGAKFKEMQYSPEQSQFIASRGYSAKEICRYYNVPPALVQIFEDYKFSTVDAMIQQFVMTCVRNDAIRFERAIARQVIRTQGRGGAMVSLFENPYVFEFIIEALLRGDPKKKAETLEIERRNGIRSSNEWRALNNEEPLPGNQGDKYLVPSGFEDLATLGSTYAKGSSGGSTNSGESNTAAALPDFDRQQVARALESGVPKHQDRSRGASASESTTVRDELQKAAITVLVEAHERLNRVLDKELSRIEKSGGDVKRIDTAWTNHCQRLQSAFLPGCEVWCQMTDGSAENLAESLAMRICIDADLQVKIDRELIESCEDETDAD